jgi:hypothetical protein
MVPGTVKVALMLPFEETARPRYCIALGLNDSSSSSSIAEDGLRPLIRRRAMADEGVKDAEGTPPPPLPNDIPFDLTIRGRYIERVQGVKEGTPTPNVGVAVSRVNGMSFQS